ncbi:hypothetical protein AJ80_01178 [Polytolypa hystricis UAMH7299]|uniref:Zn(2)-C6 fungal-type domain-containing protein n=1 Tax=Polytolypa hystricis (strain UAMH7299) TaxID=1447883 RepID=A0A2B7Z1M2_POLH7|nr:hypothetical protein AJ80_01178 [Polytolypa hystricis UAMH7299]
MPTKRTHNKTRLGCGQCRKRRIKCDEKHPVCDRCRKRGLDCSFLFLAPTTRLPTPITTSAAPTSTAATPKTPYEVQVFRCSPSSALEKLPRPVPQIPDLNSLTKTDLPKLPPHVPFNDPWKMCRDRASPYDRILLNHYQYTTCLTLAADEPGKAAWQIYVPQFASEYNFLVHGILAVSSLHLAHRCKGKAEREKMNIMAVEQMNRALSHFRVELANIHKGNAPALFACAHITVVYLFRMSVLDLQGMQASIPTGMTEPPNEIIDRSIHSIMWTFWALRGAISVLIPSRDWVVHSKMSPVCTRDWWPKDRVPANVQAMSEDRRLLNLEQLWIHPDRKFESHFNDLSSALSVLRRTYALVSMVVDSGKANQSRNEVSYPVDSTAVGMLKDWAAMFIWVTQLTEEFVALVKQKNVEALVITAYYAVLLGRVQNVWWLDGLGGGMIRAIALALGPEHLHLIEWPAQVLNVDIENLFGLGQLTVDPVALLTEF